MRSTRRRLGALVILGLLIGMLAVPATPAAAIPVCTDGYMGGAPREVCGGRIFPEAAVARGYVQYSPLPDGFREYQYGVEYLAQLYPRWVEVMTLADLYGDDAVSAGADRIRATAENDTGDGRDILVVRLTDEDVPDEGKETLFFSLSVHGNERGGLEGGLRTAEDLAMAAERNGPDDYITDGVNNYQSTTGRDPVFHSYPVRHVLAREVVYLVDFNIDGWVSGELEGRSAYARGNSIGTDLNRQMPTVGRINAGRNPLEETETGFGFELTRDVAAAGRDGLMAYAADIHGELTSRAYIDIMYPAGEFDSVDHRRLMAIAERTKSVVDATLYAGIQNEIEEATGGNEGNGVEDYSPAPCVAVVVNVNCNSIPTMPAHWATVWDTLGYTDTGFIGDYMATDLGVTGMDYEIFLNHTVPERVWNVYLQENHINGTRAIIKTAMAYALTQGQEFSDDNVMIDPAGRAGFVFNPDLVTDSDADGPGRLPGPDGDGIGNNGDEVTQASYAVTNQQWFLDTSRLMGERPFVPAFSGDIARDGASLDAFDTLVLADTAVPADPQGRSVDEGAYWANLRAWVERGGNLVLTDRALHGLGAMGIVPATAVNDISVYQPYANFTDFEHPMANGLRPNARQLVEAATIGYGIGNSASPMTVVATAAFETAGGHVVGTTGNGAGTSDDGTQTSVGELPLGEGRVRIMGGALPTPTETNDHRYGLRNYGLTFSGLFVLENAIVHDAPSLGVEAVADYDAEVPPFVPDPTVPSVLDAGAPLALTTAIGLALAGLIRRRRQPSGA